MITGAVPNIIKGKIGVSVNNEIESIYTDKAEVVGIFRASELYNIDHKFLEDKLNYQSMFNNLMTHDYKINIGAKFDDKSFMDKKDI